MQILGHARILVTLEVYTDSDSQRDASRGCPIGCSARPEPVRCCPLLLSPACAPRAVGRQPTYDEYAQIMTGYTPEQLPVPSGIAREFGGVRRRARTDSLPGRSGGNAVA